MWTMICVGTANCIHYNRFFTKCTAAIGACAGDVNCVRYKRVSTISGVTITRVHCIVYCIHLRSLCSHMGTCTSKPVLIRTLLVTIAHSQSTVICFIFVVKIYIFCRQKFQRNFKIIHVKKISHIIRAMRKYFNMKFLTLKFYI